MPEAEKEINESDCKLLSLVVPCYNESLALPCFMKEVERILPQIEGISIEVVLINDGSQDDTLDTMMKMCKMYSYVRFVSFSRNFGKESAILAGLRTSKGDWVAVMDADLQDPGNVAFGARRGVRLCGHSENNPYRRTSDTLFFCKMLL